MSSDACLSLVWWRRDRYTTLCFGITAYHALSSSDPSITMFTRIQPHCWMLYALACIDQHAACCASTSA